MKVLLFTLEYPPFFGGVSKYYENLVGHWPERDNIFVLDNNDNGLINEKLPAIKWLPSICRLWKTVRKNRIDHVIVGQVLPLGISTYLISFLLNFRYTVFIHFMDYEYANRTSRKKWITDRILQKADKIICNNSCVAGMVKEAVRIPEKVEVVNPGINIENPIRHELALKLKEKYSLGGKTVLFSIGRLVKRKGFDMVVDAMPVAFNKVPNLWYFMAGTGPDGDYLKDKIAKLPDNIKNNIVMLGKINEEEKWAWLEACDIFITPSRNIDGDVEGFGIVYLEANIAGKPVIAGDSGGVKDAVEDNVNGLLVDPEDIGKIGDAIVKLSIDKELRMRLGQQGQIRAAENFNWDRQVKKIYNIIN